MAGAWAEDADWGTLVWLVVVTGLRRRELVGLRWKDIDLAAGALYLWDTKTGQMRRVSFDGQTAHLLRTYDRNDIAGGPCHNSHRPRTDSRR